MKKRHTKTKSKFILTVLIILIICFLIGFIVYEIGIQKTQNSSFSKEQAPKKSDTFRIRKIILFSSADAVQNEATNKSTWNVNVSQFTDIAIYIDNHLENGFSKENTIAKLYIDNIQYAQMPTLGTPFLYYKNQNDFGKLSFNEENRIQDCLNFEIIPYENERNFEKPEIYDTSFSPICLGFTNKDIKTNYSITNIEEPLRYDGSLLKRCNIGLTRINCTVSFDVHIINQANEHFKSTLSIEIPLKDNSSETTIYDGFTKQEITKISNFSFYIVDT